MNEHYYTKDPKVDHRPQVIKELLRGRTFTFNTDSGVFSKGGVDFGSKLLIETMQFPNTANVLDVGCGYGPIGLAAATIALNGRVTMIDLNERAVMLTRENAALNQIHNVEIRQSDLFEKVANAKFDVILSNPPIRAGKQVVHTILEQSYELLNPGGSLWIVIQKKQGAPSAFAKLQQTFEEAVEITKNKGYRIYRATKETH